MKKYGYIRVSTKEQNPERQYAALEQLEIPKKDIYVDKISGKNFARPAYRKMMKRMQKGDVLIIKSIDRLGRDYGEILEEFDTYYHIWKNGEISTRKAASELEMSHSTFYRRYREKDS